MFDFTKKRILITQPMMHWFTGSTVVTIELAEYLQEQGAEVTVYTCFCDDPVRTVCKEKRIRVDRADEEPRYRLSDFDYIWVHSQILPLSIVEELHKKLPKCMPKFVFLHMSAMDWLPDEKPWIKGLEEQLSSVSLTICEEVEEIVVKYFDKPPLMRYFRNPAPIEFSQRLKPINDKLKNVLIVSNHPPEEVLEAKGILRKQGINVVSLGEYQETYKLTDIKLLSDFDAVITIAKTVQYCLVSGTPVYIYDWFGGPGYLNARNYDKTRWRNYSGRGFKRKSAETIAAEIVKDYARAKRYQQANVGEFAKDLSIEKVVPGIFSELDQRGDLRPLSDSYYESLKSAEIFAEKRFMDASWVRIRADEAARVPGLERENQKLRNSLRVAEDDLRIASEKLNAKSYRAFNKIISPYAKLRAKLKRK